VLDVSLVIWTFFDLKASFRKGNRLIFLYLIKSQKWRNKSGNATKLELVGGHPEKS